MKHDWFFYNRDWIFTVSGIIILAIIIGFIVMGAFRAEVRRRENLKKEAHGNGGKTMGHIS